MTTSTADQQMIITRLARIGVTGQTARGYALILDPETVRSASDSDLAFLVSGTLPNRPLNPGEGLPLGILGALNPSRWVGSTTNGHPTSGLFLVGDWVIAPDGVWYCTAAGAPGTWINLTAGGGGGGAPVDSPTFTGNPKAPTPTVGDNDTSIATTAFVAAAVAALLVSPTFTGDPKAPTPAPGDNDTSVATTAFVVNAMSSKAPLASPAFTGNPTAPTPTPGDNDTTIATTAFVAAAVAAGVGGGAPLNSPAFTGNPTAPTPTAGDNDTSIATTAFVVNLFAGFAPLASPALTGNPTAPTPTFGDNDTSIATTAFVAAAVAAVSGGGAEALSTKTASYTLALADAQSMVEINLAAASTVTIPTNASVAFPIGTRLRVRQANLGYITFVPASGVTLDSRDYANRTTAIYAEATLTKRATNEWVLGGDVSTPRGKRPNALGSIGARSHLAFNFGMWPYRSTGTAAGYTTAAKLQETSMGRKVDIVMASQYSNGTWGDIEGLQILDFLDDYAATVPVLMLPPFIPGGSWATAVGGSYDSHWQTIGANIAAKRPGMITPIRLAWESNGDWYIWGVSYGGGTTANFIAGWQRCVTNIRIGAGAEAANIIFVYSLAGLQTKGSASDPIGAGYPGNAYVDAIGLDIYDVQDVSPATVTTDPDIPGCLSIMNRALAFAVANGKPLSLDEWGLHHTGGTNPEGGDNPNFIKAMLRWIKQNRENLLWANYFQDDDTGNVNSGLFSPSVNNNPNSRAAWKTEILAL